MFKQAKQSRAFEDVIYQIQEAILQGELNEGDKLPSERDLKEIFKISRGTLREALRALEQKRLIQIKTGVNGGAFISQLDTRQVSDSLDLLLRYQKISLKELGEFREAIEPLVASKAVKNASKEDISRLRTLLQSIKDHLNAEKPKWDELMTYDREFHLNLAHIAGNRVFESILRTIYDNIDRYFDQFLPKNVEILKGIHQDFRKIIEAIEESNSHGAEATVYRHVRRFNLMMEESERRRH